MEAREVLDIALGQVDGNQAELARRLKRSETTVSRWLTGRNGIDFESALRLARLTGLSAREVVKACGLDPALVPTPISSEPATEGDDPIEQMIRQRTEEMREAVRGTPREFWSTIIRSTFDRAIDGARDMAQLVSDSTKPPTTPVTDTPKGPVTRPKGADNKGESGASSGLPIWNQGYAAVGAAA